MGVRVHKVIGYGLRGFKPTEEQLERLMNGSEMTIVEFGAWCEQHMQEILALPVTHPKSAPFMFRTSLEAYKEASQDRDPTLAWCIHECIHFDPESGFDDAIVFTPPEYTRSWSRHDDIIDWAEESSNWMNKDGHVDRFEQLKIGIYPWDLGEVPLSVGAVLLYYGLGDLWPKLHEALYVYWG